MPNLDKTGPLGQGPRSGRRFGFLPRRGVRKQETSKECVCPKCGYKEEAPRGIPCTERICPKCNTPMKGQACL
jgi:hypothetical protein